MIRFPNPGSNIDQLKKIFDLIYVNLSKFESFDLNNMAIVMTDENVASSSGYIGTEALERSYQTTDTSRNPLYNQAKMYAEIYRLLGWITSTEKTSLHFNFTYLGAHIAFSGNNFKNLFEQCILGIYYQNQNLDVKFKDLNYPFISILLMANGLDNIICRDEILLGPMNLSDFSDDYDFSRKQKLIVQLRNSKNYSNLTAELKELADSLSVQVNTLHNYTRFVISTLEYTGWMKKIKSDVYGSKVSFLELTHKGKAIVNDLLQSKIIRGEILELLDKKIINKVVNYTFLKMLSRADYDVQNELELFADYFPVFNEMFGSIEIYFSPFQYFNKSSSLLYFPELVFSEGEESSNTNITVKDIIDVKSITSIASIVTVESNYGDTFSTFLERILIKNSSCTDSAIKDLMKDIIKMKQNDFYPLIANLLEYIFNKEVRMPQAGVNNERFDLIMLDQYHSIPIEVKSPTEEHMLSVKAIRQALENKIIMTSRYSNYYNSTSETISLAIGYSIPNDRSDVYRIIDDIYTTFGVNIAIIDVETLLNTAFFCLKEDKKFNLKDLNNLKGLIKFENI